MRSFKSIRPEAGTIPYNCARDLAWALAAVEAKEVVLALGSGQFIDPVLRLLGEEITKRDGTLFRRLHIIQTHENPPRAGHLSCLWTGIDTIFGKPAVAAGQMTYDQFHRTSWAGNGDFEAIETAAVLGNLGGKVHAALIEIGGGRFNPGGPFDKGSIAGIFPGNRAIWGEKRLYVGVDDAPKPPGSWVTLTPFALRNAGYIAALLQGEDRRDVYERMSVDGPYEECPARLLLGDGDAEVTVYHDIVTP